MSRRFTTLSALALSLALLVTACGSSKKSSTPATTPTAAAAAAGPAVAHLAFYADMATVDPDVFYDIEGDAVTLSVYDGLLRYKPDSTTLTGALASSWTTSKDGLRYTFKLRPNAQFSDGSQVTSAAVKTSFQRRTKVNQGPAYMLADVARYLTPSPKTFVVVLKKPTADFLDLMASAWGPKVIDPKVLAAHKADAAQKYLKTHAVGTGPFMLTSFKQGTGYTLTRNPHYWGSKPYFSRIEIAIAPDVSSQLLKLQRGDLDAILHGFPLANLDTVKADKKLAVHTFSSLGTMTLDLNFNRKPLHSLAVRRAVIEGMNVPELVKEVWGNTATVPADAYPSPLLSSGAGISYPYDVAKIKAAIPKGLKIDVVYTPDSSGVQRRLADLIRQKLALVGATANVHQVELGTVFGYRDNVQKAADIYLSTPTPDAAHPDAWGRIVWYTKGGLNFFNYSNKGVDAALDAGLRAHGSAAAADYARAGKLATADWSVAPIAQVQDVVVTRADLGGVQHMPAYPWTLDLGALHR
ncbi:MAG: ABC transporter substrate-binding protein [Gaiellaceae bacterium]